MSGDLIQAGIVVGIVALVVWRCCRAIDDDTLRRWEERFSVTVPDELRGEAARRLHRDRALRGGVIAAGLLVAWAPAFVNLVSPERSSDFANPALGQAWLLAAAGGALVAEMVVSNRPSGARRAAMVRRRRIGDYVHPRWVAATAGMAGLAVVAAAVGSRGDAVDREWWWAYAAGGVLAVAATGLGLRVVRDRAMAAPDGPRRALDEAFRADGAHHVVGAGLALAAASTAGALDLVSHDVPLIGLPGYVLAYLALGGWWALARSSPWSVDAARLAAA